MRAPPESLMPMIGQPIRTARSMTLTIFSANTSPRLPPKTVKSWLKTKTLRPSISPWPVTTPSPQGRLSSSPKPCARWRVNMSSSTNEPGSSSRSMRSRAVSLPRACWRSTAASVPAWRASSRERLQALALVVGAVHPRYPAARTRSYSPNSSRSTPHTSPTVRPGAQRLAHRRQQVAGAAGGVAHRGQGRLDGGVVARLAQPGDAGDLVDARSACRSRAARPARPRPRGRR